MGIDALAVVVEVNVGEFGEPVPVIVGMATTAVRESKDRVWSALGNSHYTLPVKRTTIHLAPGHLRKEGSMYDLPIAVAVLQATGQLHTGMTQKLLLAGELSLSGELRPVRGGLALAVCALREGLEGLILPPHTAAEAALIRDIPVYQADSLNHACALLEGRQPLQRVEAAFDYAEAADIAFDGPDFADVKGQHSVRRAVEVAAGGGHNILLIGPPGSGKSMISKRLAGILPPLQESEFLDILRIYSASGKTLDGGPLRPIRPFRSPHHTISDVGLIGGGAIPGPGEISLAHHGVLFLDEMPEFKRGALEVLRQPLEDGEVTISRSAGRITLPASFMLVSAMNPCPCGYLGDSRNRCECHPRQVQNYRSRISGPLLDRIDIHVDAPALSIDQLRQHQPGESTSAMRDRVIRARQFQADRLKGDPSLILTNARMLPRHLRQFCRISTAMEDQLQAAMNKLNLSARAYDRILKVARTIADLDSSPSIQSQHLNEAIHYRSLDRG